jgi:hypothetical protein
MSSCSTAGIIEGEEGASLNAFPATYRGGFRRILSCVISLIYQRLQVAISLSEGSLASRPTYLDEAGQSLRFPQTSSVY